MKRLWILLSYFLIFATFVYMLNELSHIRETANTDRVIFRQKNSELQKENEALQKEIRLLRTDMDILIYGYEGGQNGKD